MSQAVSSNFFLYADGSCLTLQDEDVEEIEKTFQTMTLKKNCNWLVDNKSSIHFSEDKNKLILLAN